MTDKAHDADSFESRLDAGLAHIAAATPVPDAGEFDTDAPRSGVGGTGVERNNRNRVLAVAAAVVAVGVIGSFALVTSDSDGDTIRSSTPPDSVDEAPATTFTAGASTTSVADVASAETTPVETTPAETTPAETTPAETTPAETAAELEPIAEQTVPTAADLVVVRQAALRGLTGFSATSVRTDVFVADGTESTQSARYTLLPDGSFYADTGDDTFGSFDPATGIVLGAFRGMDGEMKYQEIVGQSDNSLPLGILGGFDPTQPLRTEPDASPIIREVDFEGRSAWELTYVDTYSYGADGTGEVTQTEVVVLDIETGLFVSQSLSSTDPNTQTQTATLSDIVTVDAMPAEFPGTFPSGADVIRDGIASQAQQATVADVVELFGEGTAVPDGFVSGSAVPGSSAATIVVSESTGIIGGYDDIAETPALWRDATFTVREGFVSTTVYMSAQTLGPDTPVPDGYVVEDGFLCVDFEGDGVCPQWQAGDESVIVLTAGAFDGFAAFVGGQPGSVQATLNDGGISISVYGTDRETTIAILESFTR